MWNIQLNELYLIFEWDVISLELIAEREIEFDSPFVVTLNQIVSDNLSGY